MMKRTRLLYVAIFLLPLLLFSLWSFGQASTIRGTVTDQDGNPLLGVNIVIQGTTQGTVTDLSGKYELQVESGQTLEFSSVGFLTDVIVVGTEEVINMMLIPDITDLDEVIVIGYGAVKKSDLTGSVSSVKSDELVATAPTTIQNAMKGKAAGVLITSGNTVNSVPNIRIRGNRSIGATNDPLFVVDGFPLNGGLESLNPNDIESIEILKDASATAIYGSRGANGVILVSTKKGKAGAAVVEYNAYYSIGKLDRIRRVMDAGQYCELVREGNRKYIYDGNGGWELDPSSFYNSLEPDYNQDLGMGYFTQDPYVLESWSRGWEDGVWNPDNIRAFDWQMAGYRDHSNSQTHNLSIRGGSENTKYYVSGAFLDLEDIQLQSFRKRYNLHLNLDQSLGDKMAMGGNVDFSYVDWDNGKGIPTFWNPMGTPWNSPDDDVTLDGDPAYGLIEHPAGEPLQYNSFYDLDGVIRQNKSNNLIANFFFEATLLKGLKYRANFGTSLYIKQEQEFYSHFSTVTGLGNPRAKQTLNFDRGWNFENILSYSKTFDKQAITVTFVQSNEKFVMEPVELEGNELPFEHLLWYDLGTAATQSITSDFTQWTMQSWLGRINYSLLDRYLVTASLRYDGSSRLGEGYKWVPFPSLALGWRISEENFLKDVEAIYNLKLRLGYGVTGNSAVAPYSTEGLIRASRYNWGKEVGVMGYEPSTLSNRALSWETTEQYNIGLDFGFFQGRISGSVDLYQQRTYDLLMERSLPSVSGFSNITQNIGETKNRGIEIALSTTNFHTKKFMWVTDITFAANQEEITRLATGDSIDIGNNWFVGYPIDTYYDYVAAPAVWGYSAEDMAELALWNGDRPTWIYNPGDLRIIDQNDDYLITGDDRQIRGSKMPKWTMSMANTFTYGPFDLYIFMYGAFGHTIYWSPGVNLGGRYNTVNVEYWTPENPETKWIKPQADIQMPSNITAMYYWAGDFLKVSDITLGYSLPKSLTNIIDIQKIRIYAKIQNPYMYSKFEGNDPEGAIAQQRNSDTGDLETYRDPSFTMRNYLFGLNVTF